MNRNGPEEPCFLSENLYDAGNPAVMAPRFRPVALRTPPFGGFATGSKDNMPKKPQRDKRGKPPMRSRAGLKSGVSAVPHSVKDLLAHRNPTLTRLAGEALSQDLWSRWLASHLDGQLHARVTGVHERDGVLVVFAESAGWSARLRFALSELQPLLSASHPELSGFLVRVLPRS
jgi:Dna[CI] antecedent, DciA